MKLLNIACIIVLLFLTCPSWAGSAEPGDTVRAVLMAQPGERAEPLKKLSERGNRDIISSLILVMRFRGNDPDILQCISELTGEPIESWYEAMIWQQNHPDLASHPSYRALKIFLYSQLDLQFLRFIGDDRALSENLNIRLEEITWSGLKVDAIPPLEKPAFITAGQAAYLAAEEEVYGVVINGEAKAYPLRYISWHGVVNDVVGGVPVSLLHSALSGSAILYSTRVAGYAKPFTFGSSGLVYRANRLLFDHQTDSLWHQFTGEPVTGKLVKSGLQLKKLPLVRSTWAAWQQQHPDTRVIGGATGYDYPYSAEGLLKGYADNENLIFPAATQGHEQFKPKTLMYGLTHDGATKVWSMQELAGKRVINDKVADVPVVLVRNGDNGSVRAYSRGPYKFRDEGESGLLRTAEGRWRITEGSLQGPDGERAERLPGNLGYWFAWVSFFANEGKLAIGSSSPQN